MVVPGVTVAGDGLVAVVGVVVDGEEECVDAGAAGGSGVAAVVYACRGVGVAVAVVVPGVAVAGGDAEAGVGVVVEGEVECVGAWAAVGGVVVAVVGAAGGVLEEVVVVTPCVAVACRHHGAGTGVVVEGEEEGVGTWAAVGGGVAVGVDACGVECEGGAVVVPCVAVAGGLQCC